MFLKQRNTFKLNELYNELNVIIPHHQVNKDFKQLMMWVKGKIYQLKESDCTFTLGFAGDFKGIKEKLQYNPMVKVKKISALDCVEKFQNIC
jgi:hypothetical protein